MARTMAEKDYLSSKQENINDEVYAIMIRK